MFGADASGLAPVRRDRFSPCVMNPHQVVMAGDGSEGSLYAAMTLMRESGRGVEVYVIDTRGMYGALVESLGGVVLKLGPGGPALNPFALWFSGADRDVGHRGYGVMSLVDAMAGGSGELEFLRALDLCLTGFYGEDHGRSGPGILGTSGFEGFLDYLGSDQARYQGRPGLLAVLQSCRADAGFLLGTGGWEALQSGTPVCLDLSGVPEELQPLAAAVCVESVWGLVVSDAGVMRLLLVDEFCTLLSIQGFSEVLHRVVIRARKQRLGVMNVTSDVESFLAGRAQGGRRLLQNTAFRMAFRQEQALLGPVQDTLGLSPESVEFLQAASACDGVLVNECGDEVRLRGGECSAREREVLSRSGLL